MSIAAATLLFQSLQRNEKFEKKKRKKHVKKTNNETNKQKSNAFASPRRPQFWKSPMGTKVLKTDFAIQCVCVVSVGAIFMLMLLVSPDTNFVFNIFLFFCIVETQCLTLESTLDAAFFHGLLLWL